MKCSSSACGRATKVLSVTVLASLLSSFAATKAAGAEAAYPYPDWPAVAKTAAPTPQKGAEEKNAEVPPQATTQPSAEEAAKRKAWRATMSQTPLPKKGCFKSTFPSTEWQEVPCGTASPNPFTVGNANNFAAQSSGTISSAIGSFDRVTGVTSETGTVFGPNCTILVQNAPNVFSLQLNANGFTTSACSGSTNRKCFGWQQFILSNHGCNSGANACIGIQYWLFNYIDPNGSPNQTCPPGWNNFKLSPNVPGNPGCWKNANNNAATIIPFQAIEDLGQLRLTGTIQRFTLEKGNELYAVAGDNSLPDLASKWNRAEFNIFGDGCGSQANFNNDGVTIVPNTGINDGTQNAPTCVKISDAGGTFTVETNNLNLVDACCTSGGGFTEITFTESNVPGARAPCGCIPLGQSCDNFPPLCCDVAHNECSNTGVCGLIGSGGGPGQNCCDGNCRPPSCRPHRCCGVDGWVCGTICQ